MCAARKDRERLFKRLRKMGWTVEKRKKSGHVKLTSPRGGCYFTGSTPSDVYANRNLVRDLRKIGPVP